MVEFSIRNATRVASAILFLLVLAGVVAVLTGSLERIVQQLMQFLFGGFYDQSAIDSASAMSYAVSCSSLIHSYTHCDDPGNGLSSQEREECEEMAQMFNSGPVTPRLSSRSCSEATTDEGAKFGDVSVTCDVLTSGENSDAGCEIRGFTLPQEFGDGSIPDEAASFLLGNGHPKYLLYYEAFDHRYAKDWESRLTGTSGVALATGALVTGMITASTFVVTATPGATSSAMKRVADSVGGSRIDDAVDAIDTTLQPIKNLLPAGPRQTYDNAMNSLRFRMRTLFGGLRHGIPTFGEVLVRPTREVTLLNHRISFINSMRSRTGLLENLGDDAFGDASMAYWRGTADQPGLRQLLTESDEVTDSALRRRLSDLQGEIDGSYRLSSSQRAQIAEDISQGLTTADEGLELARAANYDPSLFWRTTARASMYGDRILRTGGSMRAVRYEITSGYDTLRNVGSRTRQNLLARSDGTICGARPLQVAAASAAFQDATHDMTTQEDFEERYFAASIEPLALGTSGVVASIREACGSGRSPTRAIAGTAGTATAMAVAAMAVKAQKDVDQGISKDPKGVNTLVLKRPWNPPRTFPLNKYANWWYVNLDPAQAFAPQRRLMLASPCYPRSNTGDSHIDVGMKRISTVIDGVGSYTSGEGNIQRGIVVEDPDASLERLKEEDWFGAVRGSYIKKEVETSDTGTETGGFAVPRDIIAYTPDPIVKPIPYEGATEKPPGYEDFDSRITLQHAEDSNFPEDYFDQRGYWDGNDPVIPEKFITSEGNAIKTLQYGGLLDQKLTSINKETPAINVRFRSTNFGSTSKGPNYCYSRPDPAAVGAKGAIFGGTFFIDRLFETVTGTVVGAPAGVLGQFLVGVAEHIAWWGAEQTFEQHWPR